MIADGNGVRNCLPCQYNFNDSVDEDYVTRVGSFITCSSPDKSEISSKRRAFVSGVGEAKLQVKTPNKWFSTSRESKLPLNIMTHNSKINRLENREVSTMSLPEMALSSAYEFLYS